MATKTSVPLSERLYFWPHYTAVVLAVRYETLLRSDVEPYLRHLEARFDAGKVREAVLDVCQTDWNAKPETIQLRPEVRKLCHGLLGPTPETEDEFWTNADGTPMKRPPRKEPAAVVWNREQQKPRFENGRALVLPKEAPETAVEQPKPKPARKPRGKRNAYQEVTTAVADGQAAYAKVKAAEVPLADQIRDMEGADLTQNYFKAKKILGKKDEASPHWKTAVEAFPLLEAECRRRGFNMPRDSDPATAVETALARPPASPAQAADGRAYVVEKLRKELKRLKGSLRSFPKGSPNRESLLREIRLVREKLDLELDEHRDTGEHRSVRDLKRKYRVLMRSFQALPDDSPAKAGIKAEVQKLRREIQQAGGGLVL